MGGRRILPNSEVEGQGIVFIFGDIPQGGTAQLMKTNVDDLVDGATAAAEASLSGLGGQRPDLALLVICLA
jgi:hypothetical protein